jgi:vanillate O-demethylase monooxygenase subunit
MFLNNAWYVLDIAARVTGELKPARVLGEPIVVYRRANGQPVALEDACPHRKLPLSMGRRIGDDVECGYHGMTFEPGGRCIRVPGGQPIPDRAAVRSYPLVERYGFLWIWMGAPALADPDKVFQVRHYDHPAWGRTAPDSMLVDCNYLYVTDNLLDPTHVAWVHPTSFGDPACRQTPLETVVLDDGVVVSRWMLDSEVAPFYRPFVRFAGRTDRKQEYAVYFPSLALIRAVFTPAGSGGPEGRLHPDTFLMDSYNFMTPVDGEHTNYFWMQTRNFAPGDAAVSAIFEQSVRAAFLEDKVILEAVHRGMRDARRPHIDLVIDSGPTRFRRRLKQLIGAESAPDARTG